MKRFSTGRIVAALAVTFLIPAVGTPAHAQLDKKLQNLQQAIVRLYDGHAVTLRECIEVAKAGSATLGVYEEDVAAARSEKSTAKAEWLPDLTASASWQRSERKDFDVDDFSQFQIVAGAPVFFVDQDGNFLQQLEINGQQAFQPQAVPLAKTDQITYQTFSSVSLRSNWTLFDGFQRVSAIKAASAALRASQANLEYQEKVLVQDVSEAFYNVLRAQKQAEVAQETEKVAEEELKRSQTYFDVGIATRSDVLQAQVRYKQTQLDTVRARNNERQAFVLLTHLMNIPGAERFKLAFDLPADISTAEIPDLRTLLEEARAQRLDLVSAKENLQASGYRITQARAGYWPQFSIFGSASYSRSDTPFRFGAQVNRQFGWGAQVSWRLFDRFVTRNQARQALAAKRRAEYNLRQSELVMESELSGFLNNLTEAKESFIVARETVDQAEEDLRLATERFKVGAGTSLDVINAQKSLAQAKVDAVNAVADFYIAKAKIDRARGL